jgi:hypothetical protein
MRFTVHSKSLLIIASRQGERLPLVKACVYSL